MKKSLSYIIFISIFSFIMTSHDAMSDLVFTHENAFFEAAQVGNIEAVKSFIKNRANVNEKDKRGFSPLHDSAAKGHVDISQLLIKNGADVNAESIDGYTPLIFSSMFGNIEIVELLLLNGASIAKPDRMGRTPLHLAAQFGHPEVVEMLILHGANLYARDKQGLTALEITLNEPIETVETAKTIVNEHKQIIAILKLHQRNLYLRYGGAISFVFFATLLFLIKLRKKSHNKSFNPTANSSLHSL